MKYFPIYLFVNEYTVKYRYAQTEGRPDTVGTAVAAVRGNTVRFAH